MKLFCCTSVVRHYIRAEYRDEAELFHEERLQLLYRDLDHEQLEEFTADRDEELDTAGYGDGFSIIDPEDMDGDDDGS